jgi:hypothetical protein
MYQVILAELLKLDKIELQLQTHRIRVIMIKRWIGKISSKNTEENNEKRER